MHVVTERFLSLTATLSVAGVMRDPKSLFALLIITVLILYGLSVGRTRALLSLLSIYIGYVLAVLFPFMPWISGHVAEAYRPYLGVAVFIILYGIVFLLISHSIRRTRLSLGEISFVQVVLISLVQIGLLCAILASLLPAATSQHLLGPLHRFVDGDRVLWVWAAASLLILPLMKARRRE